MAETNAERALEIARVVMAPRPPDNYPGVQATWDRHVAVIAAALDAAEERGAGWMREAAADQLNLARDEGETDMRQVRSWIDALDPAAVCAERRDL